MAKKKQLDADYFAEDDLELTDVDSDLRYLRIPGTYTPWFEDDAYVAAKGNRRHVVRRMIEDWQEEKYMEDSAWTDHIHSYQHAKRGHRQRHAH